MYIISTLQADNIFKTTAIMTKIYQTPETEILALQQEGVLCASDTSSVGTGANWNLEDLSDEDIIIY